MNSQRPYINPSTIGDLDTALHEFAKGIDFSSIATENLIRSGGFGDVYKGYLVAQRRTVAIKTLKPVHTEEQKEYFFREAFIMGQFDHPNVIRLEGVVRLGGVVILGGGVRVGGVVTRLPHLIIVTEYMKNESLNKFFERVNGIELDVIQRVGMMRDIADGMRYLSDMGCVHRYLAARNILVDENFVCKVSGFDDIARGGVTPVRWTAPEVFKTSIFTPSDVWSFGVVMWEIMSHGELPYLNMSNEAIIRYVVSGSRLPRPESCPQVLYDLMLSCWDHDFRCRPSFSHIVDLLDNIVV